MPNLVAAKSIATQIPHNHFFFARADTLIAGLKSLSGEVPVGRSKSGGFLGFGATEDGDIVVGPSAKIVQSFEVEGSFVHEVDALVSPLILWRYCDQLRIPGF